jgi:DTW domain-containing protein YfiP
VRLDTRHAVLILQHPQEPDKQLGTARLAHLALPNSELRVGLSWPNLKKALGREAQPSRWAVLHLGSGIKGADAGGATPPRARATGPRLVLVDKKGGPLPDQARLLQELEGIVVLDGTWSQAKALWWRNAWLLKLRRAILIPDRPSLYRELRREPRRECLSTVESIGASLVALGEPESVREGLLGLFSQLLTRYRQRPRPPRAALPREKT